MIIDKIDWLRSNYFLFDCNSHDVIYTVRSKIDNSGQYRIAYYPDRDIYIVYPKGGKTLPIKEYPGTITGLLDAVYETALLIRKIECIQ